MYRLSIRHFDRIFHAFADRGMGVDSIQHFMVSGFELSCRHGFLPRQVSLPKAGDSSVHFPIQNIFTPILEGFSDISNKISNTNLG